MFFRKKNESSIEAFMAHLDAVAGSDAERYLITGDEERPPVWSFGYAGFADEGNLTAFTYGLSSVEHVAWKRGKPELIISVDSLDKAWALAVGQLVKTLRGSHPFAYGSTVSFGQPVAPGSSMSAFVVFAPSVLSEDEAHVVLPDRTINFVQVYPIYEEEIAVINRIGVGQWFSGDYDPYSVTRERRLNP